jgi:hypothetical protein
VRRVSVALEIVLTAILLFAGGGWLSMKFGMQGFSARAEPSHIEAMMAEYAGHRDAFVHEKHEESNSSHSRNPT